MRAKMDRSTATKWMVGLLIYFVLISIMFLGVNSIGTTKEIGSNGSSFLSRNLTDGSCLPRGEVRFGRYLRANCQDLMVIGDINNENTCGNVTGCSWETVTSWWGFGSTSESCVGTWDIKLYNDGSEKLYSEFYDLEYDALSPIIKAGVGNRIGYCGLSEFQVDANLCESFGCKYEFQDEGEPTGFRAISSFFKDIITMQVNFGFETKIINTILTLMFLTLPLLIFGISIYIMIR